MRLVFAAIVYEYASCFEGAPTAIKYKIRKDDESDSRNWQAYAGYKGYYDLVDLFAKAPTSIARLAQRHVYPPSMVISDPVMYFEESDARRTMAPLRSDGSASRPCGRSPSAH